MGSGVPLLGGNSGFGGDLCKSEGIYANPVLGKVRQHDHLRIHRVGLVRLGNTISCTTLRFPFPSAPPAKLDLVVTRQSVN